jgi:hypothetical protein
MKNDPIQPPIRLNKSDLEKTLTAYNARFNKESSAAFKDRAFVYNGTPGWIKVEADSPTTYVLSIYSICPCHKQK